MRRKYWLASAAAVVALGAAACSGSVAAQPPAQAGAPVSQSAPAAQAPAAPNAPANQSAPAAQAPAISKLNLNTATREQLLTIPGVGDRMVREFLEYRPYESIVQFRREIGKYVSAEQVAAYEEYVFVPVDPNTADAETLRQLPGVDAAVAAQLIAGRPYASPQAFLDVLARHVAPGQAALAPAYLVTP